MTRSAIGIDVGGTKIAGAIVDRDGAVIHVLSLPTPRSASGADPGAAATVELLRSLVGLADTAGLELAGIGIGVPEYVDPHGRRASRLVLDWPDDISGILNAVVVDTPAADHTVIIDSDVRCAARAESRIGHGRGRASCLFVTIGTGVSHALVIGGQIWMGARGEAIALGELRVVADDRLLPDAPITVEEQASGLALERFAASIGVPPRSDHAGLEDARRRAGRIVGEAIADAVSLLDPAVVVVGGGLGTAPGTYATALAQRYHDVTSARSAAPPLLTSALGNRAGCIGAGLLAHGC